MLLVRTRIIIKCALSPTPFCQVPTSWRDPYYRVITPVLVTEATASILPFLFDIPPKMSYRHGTRHTDADFNGDENR